MINRSSIIKSIKQELRKRGIGYRELSQYLKISESATKKMFANKNFSLKRLDEICGILDLDLLELAEIHADSELKIHHLTEEQEGMIVADIKWVIVTYAAANFWTVEDICRRYDIAESDVIHYLLRLQEFGLIELRANNRIRPLLSNNFHWSPGGPIELFYQKHFIPEFFKSRFDQPGEMRITRNGDLSEESVRLLEQRFEQLSAYYEELCFNDRFKVPGNRERKGTSMVLAFRTWMMPVFEQYARQD